MADAHRQQLLEIIYSPCLHRGVMTLTELRIPDVMRGKSLSADEIALQCGLDASMTYRLLRMLTNVKDLVTEEFSHSENSSKFQLGPIGDLLCSDHPSGFVDTAALQNSEVHWKAWSALPDILRTGSQNGFVHKFGKGAFEYMEENLQYKQVFNKAMSGLSKNESSAIIHAMENRWENYKTIVDVGGGHGYLLASILQIAKNSTGIILEIDFVVKEAAENKTLSSLGVADRCCHVTGNMFQEIDIPKHKDMYILKRILHDWNDTECVQILQNISSQSARNSTLIVVDTVVPTNGSPHVSKLMDVHMMCWGNGRERTEPEFRKIFHEAKWKLQEIIPTGRSGLCLVVGNLE